MKHISQKKLKKLANGKYANKKQIKHLVKCDKCFSKYLILEQENEIKNVTNAYDYTKFKRIF